MNESAIDLIDQIFERFPFHLEADWPAGYGSHIPTSLFSSFIETQGNLARTLVRKELTENDRAALIPFAKAYESAFTSVGLMVGHDSIEQPAYITVCTYLTMDDQSSLAFASRVLAVAAAANLMSFLDIFRSNSFNKELDIPRPPKFLPNYNLHYQQKSSQLYRELTTHYSCVIDAQNKLSTANLFAQKAYELQKLSQLIKAQNSKDDVITLLRQQVQEISDTKKSLSEQKRLDTKSPVEIRHERSTWRMRDFVIDRWKNGTFKSKSDAARKIAPLLREFAHANGINPLAPTNEERSIRDWITDYEKKSYTSK